MAEMSWRKKQERDPVVQGIMT